MTGLPAPVLGSEIFLSVEEKIGMNRAGYWPPPEELDYFFYKENLGGP